MLTIGRLRGWQRQIKEGKMKKKKLKIFLLLPLIAVILCNLPLDMYSEAHAYVEAPREPAEVGKTQAELNSYPEEEWKKLMDDVLEYEEIEDLIKNFNPGISSAWDSYDSAIENLGDDINELRTAKREMESLKESAKKEGDIESYYLYGAQEKALNGIITGMNKSEESLNKKEGNKTAMIRRGQAQAVSAAKSLFLTYHSMLAGEEVLNELVALNEKLLSQSRSMVGTGLGTGRDVSAAETQLHSARSRLSSLEGSREKIRKTLIIMCGWSADANPVIGSAPSLDLSRLDKMNPSADSIKAIGNNYDLIDLRNSTYKKSPGAQNARDLTTQQLEDLLRLRLDELYADAQSKKNAYEAVSVGYQSAELAKNAADRKKNLGMISDAEYLAQKLLYTEKKTALKSAELELFQSLNVYEDAVAGQLDLE